MDAKMDSGHVPPDDTFDPDFDVSKPLSEQQALWIMDQLMCLEITWQDGYPLSQTIFTSLHIHHILSPTPPVDYSFYPNGERPKKLKDRQAMIHQALRVYCMGLIKCCHAALQLIQSQNFYEEEDFVTHLFGRELLPKFGAMEALEELHATRIEYGEEFSNDDVHLAIKSHLEFRYKLLELLAGLQAPEGTDDRTEWPQLLELLDRINSYHKLATPCPTAFSEKVQRQLATSTPPRPMLQISWDLAISKWKTLCLDMIAAQHYTSSEIIQSPAGLHKAVWAFSSRDQPCCLSRAEIQSIMFGQQAIKDEIPHYELLLRDIQDLVLPGDPLTDQRSFEVELTSDPRHVASRHMEAFMDKAIDEYLNLYRMVCQNRCRIRRTFTQGIPILDELETFAAMTDLELKQLSPQLTMKMKRGNESLNLSPLTSWTKFHKLRLMAWTVQLGFETEIYLPDELGDMYFVLARLAGQRLLCVDLILAFVDERIDREKNAAIKKQCNASVDYLTSLQKTAQITSSLAEALATFYKILMKVEIIKAPKRDFANAKLLYEARMKPFIPVINDHIPSLEEIQDYRRDVGSVSQMCGAVDHYVKNAKGLIAEVKKMTPLQAKYVGTEVEWAKEWKQTETTCVAVSVAVSQLQRACEKFGEDGLSKNMECRPEKKYHEWWVIPQLKEKAK